MTHDLPAMRRFKNRLLDAESNPLAMWLSTELAPAFGKGEEWDPFVTLVSAVEAEGSALIDAVKCPDGLPHGVAFPSDASGSIRDVFSEPCPSCGAAT
ncbi:hypothetical protein [Promicromonospora kroppenstedtii]|uniref:hypothetical protein n=1 Tax=Promicromonospora kroppenstedtii TaxID=440482 RepID=UPI0004B60788|nr:hypothetical protein [Promicromonospora kroppenstedtii]